MSATPPNKYPLQEVTNLSAKVPKKQARESDLRREWQATARSIWGANFTANKFSLEDPLRSSSELSNLCKLRSDLRQIGKNLYLVLNPLTFSTVTLLLSSGEERKKFILTVRVLLIAPS